MGKHKLTKQQFQKKFEEEPCGIDRALLYLYERQAKEERDTATNIHKNSRGFCSCDVKRFTLLATLAVQGPLSTEQRAYLRQRGRLAKYARQLNEVLDEGGAIVLL